MRNLQRDMGMAIMYITHNLGVIAEMCESAVMYLGKQVEWATWTRSFYDAQHPYMQALLRSIPRWAESAEPAGVDQGHGAGSVLDSEGLSVSSALQ